MVEDSTTRFSRRVSNYLRYRPQYPAAVADLLSAKGLVADIGSGTGFLSKPFLDSGCTVTGVEPNREMRQAGEAWLAEYPNFQSVDGRAEATTLADNAVDLIVAGQAFHWFDVDLTRAEWNRILRPGGRVALFWNHRAQEGAFMQELERIIDRFAQERDPNGVIREMGKSRIAGFFAPCQVRTAEIAWEQLFDYAALRGRILSCSYLPAEGEPGEQDLSLELRALFDQYQTDAQVTFRYCTKVYWADGFKRL